MVQQSFMPDLKVILQPPAVVLGTLAAASLSFTGADPLQLKFVVWVGGWQGASAQSGGLLVQPFIRRLKTMKAQRVADRNNRSFWPSHASYSTTGWLHHARYFSASILLVVLVSSSPPPPKSI